MNPQASELQMGAFVDLSPEAKVGEGCRLGPYCWVPAGVEMGAHVEIEGNVILHSGIIIEDGVRIGANVVFERPKGMDEAMKTVLRRGCQIGGNATLAAGVMVGVEAVVEGGAVVTTAVQPHAIVAGNPARVIGFKGAVKTNGGGVAKVVRGAQHGVASTSCVRGVQVVDLPFISDPRGNLTVGEFERTVPFQPKRYFITFDVPNARMRGEHAHRECEQFLVCVRGSCAVVVDDGQQREEVLLDRPTRGIYVPPMVWATEYKHSSDSTLMVFASHFYDPDDYIRDYSEFIRMVGSGGS
jgi:dTDP-4-dehydrorhamnose 3,5-epimerase-like enzyme/carbonic anhydrase/acetyltransferase-like protein (isoleucine patch superfamily)